MIRTTLESILCLVLSPLLAAQQISQEPARVENDLHTNANQTSIPISSLPPGMTIILLMPAFRPRPLAIDASVDLVVLHDVEMNGKIVLRAGTTLPAILTDERHGSFTVRQDETIRVHARDLQSGQPLRIRMPRDTYTTSLRSDRGDFPWMLVILTLFVVILPIAVLRHGDN